MAESQIVRRRRFGFLIPVFVSVIFAVGCGQPKGNPPVGSKPTIPEASQQANDDADRTDFFAEETPTTSTEELIKQASQNGTGIHFVKKDSKGQVKSLVMLGDAPVWAHTPDSRRIAESASEQAATWIALAQLVRWEEFINISTVEKRRNPSSKANIFGIVPIHITVNSNITTVMFGWKPGSHSDQLPSLSVRCEQSGQAKSTSSPTGDTELKEHSLRRI